MQDGLELMCWLPGGASTDFLLPQHLDLAMDFDTWPRPAVAWAPDSSHGSRQQRNISVVRNRNNFCTGILRLVPLP
jgi:NADH-quinone oxidoreductase subunit F